MFIHFCVSTVGHSSTSVLAAPDSSATMNALRDDVKENVMSNSIGEMKEENIAMSVAATTNADSTHVTSTTHSHNRTEKNRTTSARIKKWVKHGGDETENRLWGNYLAWNLNINDIKLVNGASIRKDALLRTRCLSVFVLVCSMCLRLLYVARLDVCLHVYNDVFNVM